jgi:hypothetical protein
MNERGYNDAIFKDMAVLTLNDIDFRLGASYIYRHCNFCDHLFIVTGIRLRDPSRDSQLD